MGGFCPGASGTLGLWSFGAWLLRETQPRKSVGLLRSLNRLLFLAQLAVLPLLFTLSAGRGPHYLDSCCRSSYPLSSASTVNCPIVFAFSSTLQEILEHLLCTQGPVLEMGTQL